MPIRDMDLLSYKELRSRSIPINPNNGFDMETFKETRNILYYFFQVTNQLEIGNNNWDNAIDLSIAIHKWEAVNL